MANRLDAGNDLLGVLELLGKRLPGHLRGLMVAGVRSGRLPEVLEEYVDLQQRQSELRRRVAMTLAYPFVLLLAVTAIAAFAELYVVHEFEKIFKDFGTTLPAMTVWIIEGSRPMMWFLIILVGLSLVVPILLWLTPVMGWIWPALYRLPMIGPLLRWSHLAQFARLMGLLLEQKVSLPDALRVTAAGLRNTNLAQGCCRVADDTEKGRPLDESMAARRQFPASLIPMIQWGQQAPDLPDAFRASAEMFEGRTRSHGTLLEAMLLPIMLFLIVSFIGLFTVAMFLPMIRLVNMLS
jgi:type II secretory pathway component PulF